MIFCFPGSGSRGAEFIGMRKRRAGDVDIVKYGFRSKTPAVGHVSMIAPGAFGKTCAEICDYIARSRECSGRPIALVGFSLGCLFALNCARLLQASGSPISKLICLSAPPVDAPLAGLPTNVDDGISYFERVSPELRNVNTELMRGIVEIGLLDMKVGSQFYRESPAVIDAPIELFAGVDDVFASESNFNSWRNISTGEVKCNWVCGTHESIVSNGDVLSRIESLP